MASKQKVVIIVNSNYLIVYINILGEDIHSRSFLNINNNIIH